MKKKLVMLMCGLGIVSMLAGCAAKETVEVEQSVESVAAEESEVETESQEVEQETESEEITEETSEENTSEEATEEESEEETYSMYFVIDRSFRLSDRGTSVTGDVAEGTLHVGDVVTIQLADGTKLTNTVAGIEIFGDATKESAETGETVGVWFAEDITETVDESCKMYIVAGEDTEEAAEEKIVLFDQDNVLITVKDIIYQETQQFELVLNLEITNNTPNELTLQSREGELFDQNGEALESGSIIFSAQVEAGETVVQEMKMANNTSFGENPQELEGVKYQLYVSSYLSQWILSDEITVTGIQEENAVFSIAEGTEERKGDINAIQ